LEYLLDHGETDIETLKRHVEYHAGKQERVKRVYKKLPGDPYLAMIQDAVAQLQDCAFVKRKPNQKIALADGFKVGIPLPVIKQNKKLGRSNFSCMILGAEDRKALDFRTHQALEVKAIANDLKPEGRGLRALDPETLERIESSIREYGFRKCFKILVDQHGRILDGRHRLKVFEKLGIEVTRDMKERVEVADDREAIAVALAANRTSSWKPSELRKLKERLATAGIEDKNFGRVLSAEAKRALIKAELLLDASRSNRQIAEALAVDHKTVQPIRKALENSGEIPHCSFPGGGGKGRAGGSPGNRAAKPSTGGSNGAPGNGAASPKRKADPEKQARREKAVALADEGKSNAEIGEVLGVTERVARHDVDDEKLRREGDERTLDALVEFLDGCSEGAKAEIMPWIYKMRKGNTHHDEGRGARQGAR
jgi:ParB-like chromosome segregation protein Spo0J